MIHMEQRHLEIVKSILAKYPYTFYAFGSRVKGNHRRLSDLDLCFIESIPWNVLSHIEEDFEESDLPFTVDLVDWQRAADTFKQSVGKDLELLQKGKDSKKLVQF